MPLRPDTDLIRLALRCRCPKCREGAVFADGLLAYDFRPACPVCGLDLTRADSADGPAVFLIFVLGFALVPLALLLEVAAAPPLWVHAVLWTLVALGLTLAALRPLKAYVLALQYTHCPHDWGEGA